MLLYIHSCTIELCCIDLQQTYSRPTAGFVSLQDRTLGLLAFTSSHAAPPFHITSKTFRCECFVHINHSSFILSFVFERSQRTRSETLFRLYYLTLYWTVWCCYTQTLCTQSHQNTQHFEQWVPHTSYFWSHTSLRSLGVLLSPWLSCLKSCCTACKPLLHHFLFRWGHQGNSSCISQSRSGWCFTRRRVVGSGWLSTWQVGHIQCGEG